jgi:glycosyltransferase involved in cell wall biosynthesis
MFKYSIVTPIYNEAENLTQLFTEIMGAMANVGEEWDLMCIDDGSMDASLEIIRDYAAQNPHVRYIHFIKNYGQSAALAAGFQAAQGEYIITIDSDLQNDPADIPKLLPYLKQYDMVTGWRVQRHVVTP